MWEFEKKSNEFFLVDYIASFAQLFFYATTVSNEGGKVFFGKDFSKNFLSGLAVLKEFLKRPQKL